MYYRHQLQWSVDQNASYGPLSKKEKKKRIEKLTWGSAFDLSIIKGQRCFDSR